MLNPTQCWECAEEAAHNIKEGQQGVDLMLCYAFVAICCACLHSTQRSNLAILTSFLCNAAEGGRKSETKCRGTVL